MYVTDTVSGYKKYVTDTVSGYKKFVTDTVSGYKKVCHRYSTKRDGFICQEGSGK